MANGVLHFLVAWLAVRVALGSGQRADQTGALQSVAAQPLGRVLIWLAALGFAAVAAWRAHEAWRGHRHVTQHREQMRKRVFAAGQAVLYTGLTVLAVRVGSGGGAGNGGSEPTALLLRSSFGQVVVIAAGITVGVAGLVMIVQGVRMAFREDMDLGEAPPRLRTFVERCGQVGSVTKGLAVTVIGVLVVIAGAAHRPEQAQGLDAALKTIAQQPYGGPALLSVAVGFAAYGVFALFDSVYHRV